MNRRQRWVDKLMTGAGLAEENPGKLPLVELCSDHRVLVENHNGVRKYSREEIIIGVSFGVAVIRGEGLYLSHLSPEKLVIRGKIHSVHLNRG